MNIEIKKRSPYGPASLTLGIISIVMNLTWIISIPCGILAIILGTKAEEMVGSKLGKAGKITGIVGIVLASIVVAFILIMFGLVALFG